MSPCARLDGDRHVVDVSHELYPASLRDAVERPERLYVLGNPEALARPSISIIGARKATSYGIACARMAGKCAATMGIQVVSGAAIGCDQAAQRQAVDSGGATLAVLGSGADVVYPSDSIDLLEGILENDGAIVSIQPWGSSPDRWKFPRRNAVIAALSDALVICEAGMPSGTFGTAQFAEEQGKEILVFPGSIFSPNSTGCNFLVASQARAMPLWDETCLEMAISRIYGVLRFSPQASAPADSGLTKDQEAVMANLQSSPAHPGELASSCGMDAASVTRMLALLEVQGRVVRLRDGRYSLSEREFLSHNTYHL